MPLLFDMDGTLTPRRKPISPEMLKYLDELKHRHSLYLVTGSTYEEVCEQLPNPLNYFKLVMACMGNHVVSLAGDHCITPNFPQELEETVRRVMSEHSSWAGPVFDGVYVCRKSSVNVSVVGRECTEEMRIAYAQHDEQTGERTRIAEALSKIYPMYEFSVGGMISIDIIPKGMGKEQALDYIIEADYEKPIAFFGDRAYPGGNDYSVAQAIDRVAGRNDVWFNVNSPEHTVQIITMLERLNAL